jgi:hypothetical protein
MSCRNTADSVVDAYKAVGVKIRFILDDVDPADLLDGVSASAATTFDWYAIPGAFTVHERNAGAIADADIKIKFAHPAKNDTPADIYAAILHPEDVTTLRVAVADDGEIGTPDGAGGYVGATVYRFGSVLGSKKIRTPVAHTWHLGTLGG